MNANTHPPLSNLTPHANLAPHPAPHAAASDLRAIEIAAATDRALRTHEETCREREDRREARAGEFREEMRRALGDLRGGLREVSATIDRLQSRIMATLLSAVVSLLGLSGWLATKLLGW